MTQDEALVAWGAKAKVVYRVPHLPRERWEVGVITRITDRGAFVRYGNDGVSKLTRFEDLELFGK